MNKEQIKETLQALSKCQGFYGRYLREIKDNEEEVLKGLEKQGFKDPVDLVLFLEG